MRHSMSLTLSFLFSFPLFFFKISLENMFNQIPGGRPFGVAVTNQLNRAIHYNISKWISHALLSWLDNNKIQKQLMNRRASGKTKKTNTGLNSKGFHDPHSKICVLRMLLFSFSSSKYTLKIWMNNKWKHKK